jgi:hypothetical protein
MPVSVPIQEASFEAQNAQGKKGMLDIPIFIYATAFASLSIVIGLIWDISWHVSIGRDGLLSAPHLAIYLGAVVAGFFFRLSGFENKFLGNGP